MKALKSVSKQSETNEFSRHGDVIGWTWEALDGTGYYASYGARKPSRRSAMASKHATREEAAQAIRVTEDNVPKHTTILR
jgi:hypothetical protein